MRPYMPSRPYQPRLTRSSIKPVPIVVMAPAESLKVVTSGGQPLLEITYDSQGPTIHLAQDNLQLGCSGELNLTAKSITMQSSEDVTIKGQTIRLN